MELKGNINGALQLIRLIFIVCLIANLTGCVWHFIALDQIKQNNKNTWLHSKNIENADWWIKYINSIYFSFVTMTTVGYGDISPQNYIEKIFCIFNMILACGIFAYCINSIGNIFNEMQVQNNQFKYF